MILRRFFTLAATAALLLSAPAMAQITEIDPNRAADYQEAQARPDDPAPQEDYQPVDAGTQESADPAPAPSAPAPSASGRAATASDSAGDTLPREDVFSAAEGVFGSGAKGLADIIERILKDQGEPIAYIAGQEVGGAVVVGLRYGSGTMHHKIEGDRLVYWTGPSVGFDLGADANKVFVLVYNLHDSEDIFRRFPSAEGNAYFIGGFTASYQRRGDIVLIPIRLGVGLRLGVNAGYMRFSKKNRWIPF